MSTKLLTSATWKHITSEVKKCPTRCDIAVAYFGDGASKMLPLKKGSTLIVDMSPSAVKSGQTKPSEVLKLINRGVDVHSVSNLHAKVFVIGKVAIIGSTNASHNSQRYLIEAALKTSDPRVVNQCRKFVKSLRGELVTPEYAKKMEKEYRPPRFQAHGRGVSTDYPFPLHSKIWIVPLQVGERDKEYIEARAQSVRAARRKIKSLNRYYLDEFDGWGSQFIKKVKTKDLIIQIVEGKNGTVMVYPAARLIHTIKYSVGRENRKIMYLEAERKLRRKSLNKVIAKLGPIAEELQELDAPKLLRNKAFTHTLLNLTQR